MVYQIPLRFCDISEEIKEEGCANRMISQPDGSLKVTQCPWFTQFKEMGLRDAGALYCQDLDSAISRGFNPELGYSVDQNLHYSGCCVPSSITVHIPIGPTMR